LFLLIHEVVTWVGERETSRVASGGEGDVVWQVAKVVGFSQEFPNRSSKVF
jgi:hypothetical protein